MSEIRATNLANNTISHYGNDKGCLVQRRLEEPVRGSISTHRGNLQQSVKPSSKPKAPVLPNWFLFSTKLPADFHSALNKELGSGSQTALS